jgi:hypothetical protein
VWWQYPTQAEPERRPSRRPFHELPNVLITPHSSALRLILATIASIGGMPTSLTNNSASLPCQRPCRKAEALPVCRGFSLGAVTRLRSGLKHDVFERFAAREAVEIGGHDTPSAGRRSRRWSSQLTRIVAALEGPTVLLLDAPWGTGKTTFIKMWLGELANVGIPTIYFDAFTNDYHDDAFLTVAGEIVARAEELKPRSKLSEWLSVEYVLFRREAFFRTYLQFAMGKAQGTLLLLFRDRSLDGNARQTTIGGFTTTT